MPHCILEASDNLLDQPDWGALLREIHRTLAATGLFQEADIKSRVIRPEAFRVADGAPDRAFVALNLQILAGRPDEVKSRVSDALMGVLAGAFPLSSAGMRLNLTVQISDLHAPSYRRQTSG
ncbi:5-carboxymethyl-2-hydroxymuconate Delta-isomerase [Geothrix sp. 21YS21S-4]|uniref:5-carboxymethyl-2-hydroxymuconate Delta-isomerase n=1 Tax=Geothrix sp. 21YS21S-4 TaxID=3068889 RepID=UPI0027BAD409|nr:5-carboxymethyl-2-hydroxymuconate Delta-isomerase [Geothrix sp. 21YS21S-4]